MITDFIKIGGDKYESLVCSEKFINTWKLLNIRFRWIMLPPKLSHNIRIIIISHSNIELPIRISLFSLFKPNYRFNSSCNRIIKLILCWCWFRYLRNCCWWFKRCRRMVFFMVFKSNFIRNKLISIPNDCCRWLRSNLRWCPKLNR